MNLARFRRNLLAWYRANARDLPWRQTRDPYPIWLSEVMLQQTRVAAVLPYYEKFLTLFPTVEALAAAAEDTLLAAWAGLGYYSRARNLQRAARDISARGGFPRGYDEIAVLPGIGPYTAAAVASIAFDLPHAAVDGNVLRVVARLDANAADIASNGGRQQLAARAQELLAARAPGEWNQAMMELGATVCLPKNPQCHHCPVALDCAGFAAGIAAQLPTKTRKQARQILRYSIAIAIHENRILFLKRADNEQRLAAFWELPRLEQVTEFQMDGRVGEVRHAITFHDIRVDVLIGTVVKAPPGFQWIERHRIGEMAVTTLSRKALAKAGILG